MYSSAKPDPTRVALAHAITAAHFRDYLKALEFALPLDIKPDSNLWIEWQRVLYLAYRGTGDADAARKHLQEFDKATSQPEHRAQRVYLAKEVATHFSDVDTATWLIQDLPDEMFTGSKYPANLPFVLNVLRGKTPMHEQLNFLWRATALDPDEDWMASYIISHSSDPAIIKRVLELLDSIKLKCNAGYEDAIEHRKSQAQRKLEAL